MSQSLTLWCNKNFAPYFVRQTGSYLGSQTLIYPMIVSCTLIYLHIWYFIKKNICTHIHMYIFDITIKNIYLRIDIYILDISCPWKTKKGYLCCNIPSLCQIHPIVNIPLYVANTFEVIIWLILENNILFGKTFFELFSLKVWAQTSIMVKVRLKKCGGWGWGIFWGGICLNPNNKKILDPLKKTKSPLLVYLHKRPSRSLLVWGSAPDLVPQAVYTRGEEALGGGRLGVTFTGWIRHLSTNGNTKLLNPLSPLYYG